MKVKYFISSVLFSAALISQLYAQSPSSIYKDRQQPTEVRVADLLSQMTLEEKVGQLLCPLGWEMYERENNRVTYSQKFKQLVDSAHVGMFWAVFRADPWTQKTLENGLDPKMAAEAANAMQRYAVEQTRLGIPIFIAEEAPHGHMAIGTTVFPTGIGMASSWNIDLQERVARVVAKEVRLQGGHIGYGPVLDLSRDPRWSRVEEAFGEDPVLSGAMGAAYATGAGAGQIQQSNAVISTIKHFIAYGIPEGGHNGNTALVGPRELHENFLPPFKQTVDAGALSVMTAYNSVDGIPCTANPFLLTDILRDNWKFDGFVVSDLGSIDGLYSTHRVASSLQEAGVQALSAGVDADLGAKPFGELVDAVRSGQVDESAIDTAAARILRLKFDMGLFENPYVDPRQAEELVRTASSIQLAREAAQQSIVLLENRNGTLPLSKSIQRVAVIGPNADSPYNQLGDYTAPQERDNIKTVYDGIQAKLPNVQVVFERGCAIRDTTQSDIARAVEAAKTADVAIVVVGGSSARDFRTKYIETGAAVASAESISDMESGEGFDRATLELLGDQMKLLRAIKATGTPLVVVYIQGRPLDMNWASEEADALLTAWYPGQEGGNAVADVLFGDYNPAGRLPISVPKSVGQLPVYYNKKVPKGHDYVEVSAAPRYTFGHGRSYSTFDYHDMNIEEIETNQLVVSFMITNSSTVDGDEVAQLYVRDEIASTVQPLLQLKKFQRLFIKAGESVHVQMKLDAADLSVVDYEMKGRVVEKGAFKIMVGAASNDIRLTDTWEARQTTPLQLYP